MKQIPRFFFAGCLAMTSCPVSAQEPLKVDITQGVSAALSVAVADRSGGSFLGTTKSTVGEADLGKAIAQVIRDDLATAGYYRVSSTADADWGQGAGPFVPLQAAGVQLLVVGTVSSSNEAQLAYSCTAYDVYSGMQVASRTFAVLTKQWRRAGHKCADLVFEDTTGDPGHFDTRIAYIAESGPKVGRVKRLAVMDHDGANPVYLTRGLELVAMPRFSPDGRQVVYMTFVERQPALMIYDLVAGKVQTVKVPAGTVFAPRFSPDGRSLVFSLGVSGETDIYILDMASGDVRQLTRTAGIDTSASFSPDGRRIVFESSRSGSQQLYVMAADGSNQARLSFGQGRYGSPSWSPSGDMIAFTHMDGASFRIGVMKADGSRERLITDDWQDESPSWAPSGRAIAFLRTRKGEALPEVWVVEASGRATRRVRTLEGGSDPSWSGPRP